MNKPFYNAQQQGDQPKQRESVERPKDRGIFLLTACIIVHECRSALFFGDFIRSCSGPSDDTVMRTDSGCADGCFGMEKGAGGIKNTNTAEKDEKEEDPTSVIAHAMNTLSIQEREHAHEDMHGVSAMVQETPELIVETLH
jgi:hypothetical protein